MPVFGAGFQNVNIDTTSSDTGLALSRQVGSVSGNNVGNGAGLFSGTTGLGNVTLNFKSLIGGTGVIVQQDQDNITLIATGEIQSTITFASLTDGPESFSPHAVLVGSANAASLEWTPPATTANTVLTYTGSAFSWSPVASTGVQSIISDGLIRANVASSGVVSLVLASTGVSAGSYSAANIVVDSQGRVTHASSTVGLAAVAALTGDVVGSGALGNVITRLAPTGVVPGTYTKPIIDATGRVTGNGALSPSDIATALGFVPLSSNSSLNSPSLTGTPTAPTPPAADNSSLVATTAFVHSALTTLSGVQSVTINGNGITVTNGTVTNSGTIGLSLAPTGVIPGVYSAPLLTIGADGRITAASSGTSGGGGSATIPASGVNPGSYTLASITVGNDGRITSAASGTPAPASTVNLVGDVSASGSGTLSTSLASIPGLVAGTFTNPTVSVDTKGRVVSIFNGAAPSGGGSTGASGSVTLVGDVSGSGTGTFTTSLAAIPGLTVGTFTNATVTVDAKGRVTAISNGSAGSSGSPSNSPSSGPARYAVTVAIDGNGNIAATSSFSNAPSGWVITRDGSNQMTVQHNLGAFPVHVSTLAYNPANSQWAMKTPNGNPPTQFSIGINSSGTTPNSFTIYGLSGSAVSGATNANVIVSVLI